MIPSAPSSLLTVRMTVQYTRKPEIDFHGPYPSSSPYTTKLSSNPSKSPYRNPVLVKDAYVTARARDLVEDPRNPELRTLGFRV